MGDVLIGDRAHDSDDLDDDMCGTETKLVLARTKNNQKSKTQGAENIDISKDVGLWNGSLLVDQTHASITQSQGEVSW